MKPSYYNFIWPTDDPGKAMIFNSITTSLVEAPTSNISLLEGPPFDYDSLPTGAKRFVDALKAGGFVLDDATDELSTLKFAVNARKYDCNRLELTIAPTLRCNFSCEYCYEQTGDAQHRRDGRHAVMPPAVRKALLKLIEQRARRVKKMSVIWFGGEPLLETSVIVELSQEIIRIAERNGVSYEAGMITNGYLFHRDPDIIRKLKNSRISFFQITLDGPPDIHNLRRKLKNDDGPTFEPIMESAKLLAKNGMQVNVRINVDRSNAAQALDLLKMLEVDYEKGLTVHLGRVMDQAKTRCSAANACPTMQEFSQVNQTFERRLHQGGSKPDPSLHYPRCINVCSANGLSTLVIDPDGDVYKCWTAIGEKSARVGNVLDFENRSQEEMAREIKWITWEPFENPDCKACKVLPICLGGCPYGPILNGEDHECAEWKYGLEYYVRARYEREKARQAAS